MCANYVPGNFLGSRDIGKTVQTELPDSTVVLINIRITSLPKYNTSFSLKVRAWTFVLFGQCNETYVASEQKF